MVFQTGGAGETIQFAMGDCILGSLLVASTELGICEIALGDSPQKLRQGFQAQFCKATLTGAESGLEQHISSVVSFIESPSVGLTLPLDIRGTPFQVGVWETLQQTQPGQTLTYSELASGSINQTGHGQSRVAARKTTSRLRYHVTESYAPTHPPRAITGDLIENKYCWIVKGTIADDRSNRL